MHLRIVSPLALGSVALIASACKSTPPEPAPPTPEPAATQSAAPVETAAPKETASAAPAETASAASMASASASAAPSASAAMGGSASAAPPYVRPPAQVAVSEGDPAKGVFTMADATKGLAGKGQITATLQTDKGNLKCELWPDKAPITVANFVGLARGLRPWKNPAGEWVKKPLYDGTPFHRIIRGFMIQGGDPKGNGSGDPGFVIPDEVWEGAHHDQRGLICMANRGPNTNGSQFFIMDGEAKHLDGGYTIFGKCSPESVVEAIAGSQTEGDRAVNPPKIKKVVVERAKS
jgi:peptidyl-prolyl cis-trans isomerase A (cyclophilin A)